MTISSTSISTTFNDYSQRAATSRQYETSLPSTRKGSGAALLQTANTAIFQMSDLMSKVRSLSRKADMLKHAWKQQR